MKLFISLSGPDGVGKTSTINLLHKTTNYAYVIYDRDIPDQICYAKLAHRKINENELIKYMYNNSKQLYVILNSEVNTIKKRMQLRNDSIVPEGTTLEQAVEFFKQYENDSNVLYIDNTKLSVEDVVNIILKKIN